MRNLLNFIIRYSTWFVFAIYVLLSCILLSHRDDYHASVLLSSANTVTSSVYRAAASVTGYFNLRSINRSLQESNAALENEVLNLRNEIDEYKAAMSDTSRLNDIRRYDYVLASVINNSTRHPRNYFTINRGTRDGVESGMGVVDHNGIVGIVNVAGPHTARVISILNQTQHFSVKLKDTPYVGSLGDPVVTSGFSTTFPYGLIVGTIMNRVRTADDNFYVLKIKLASDFKTLSTVRVINDFYKAELDSLSTFDVAPAI